MSLWFAKVQWPPFGLNWEGDLTFIHGRRPRPGLNQRPPCPPSRGANC